MSRVDEAKEVAVEESSGSAGVDSGKLVPVSESIRYRKRAQSAEKEAEVLGRALDEERSRTAGLSEQVREVRTEQELTRKLASAGVVDLEGAVLIAKSRLSGSEAAEVDGCIERLKSEKEYLFRSPSAFSEGEQVTARKTAGAKEHVSGSQAVLERAAKRAASTGNRSDLQQYLKLRRNFV